MTDNDREFKKAWDARPNVQAVADKIGKSYVYTKNRAVRLRRKGIDLPPKPRGFKANRELARTAGRIGGLKGRKDD